MQNVYIYSRINAKEGLTHSFLPTSISMSPFFSRKVLTNFWCKTFIKRT